MSIFAISLLITYKMIFTFYDCLLLPCFVFFCRSKCKKEQKMILRDVVSKNCSNVHVVHVSVNKLCKLLLKLFAQLIR